MNPLIMIECINLLYIIHIYIYMLYITIYILFYFNEIFYFLFKLLNGPFVTKVTVSNHLVATYM